MEDARDLWNSAADLLRPEVSPATWLSTFEQVRASALDDGNLLLSVPNGPAKDKLEGAYASLVADALRSVQGGDVHVRVVIDPRPSGPGENGVAPAPSPAPGSATEAVGRPFDSHEVPTLEPAVGTATLGGLSDVEFSRYTFDAFVIGSSNRFAHAAALSVAERPGKSYNPLFIYGDAGLGKTHLLQAIGHYVRENYPRSVVRYVSSETFVSEFVDAIRNGTNDSFKRRYREVDVLLVDDIQFLEGREGTLEEFFHTFNALHGAEKQIVLSSDRSPDRLSTLDKRLSSRFMWGLITDIQPPDVDTRLAILRKKAEAAPAIIPDEVLNLIAENITDNIRALEGALNRVSAFAQLQRRELTLEEARRLLSDQFGESQAVVITPQLILDATAELFGFTVDDITGQSRRRPLVTARQISMYVMRELTDLSFPNIAREFGGRDHTTVMYAVDKIRKLMGERPQIYDQVSELLQRVRRGS